MVTLGDVIDPTQIIEKPLLSVLYSHYVSLLIPTDYLQYYLQYFWNRLTIVFRVLMVEKRSLMQALDELKSSAVVLAKSPMKGICCFFPTSTYMPHGCRYTSRVWNIHESR